MHILTISRFRSVLLSATLVLATALSLHAQTATISGTILDASGSGVPDAAVNIKNIATGARAQPPPTRGTYSIPNVPVGRYDVSVEKQGFSALQFKNIELTVAQSLTLNGSLQVGAV